MGKIHVTGDIHGNVDIITMNSKHFPEQKNMTKDDYVIFLGDFGLVWYNKPNKEEDYWVDWLNTRNYTSIVVLGNHENYDRIKRLPKVDMFGGRVWKYTDSIFILERGAVYTINDKTFFTMGGATSIDKLNRIVGESWWSDEIPSNAEFEAGLSALDDVEWSVDYILTHTTPNSVIDEYAYRFSDRLMLGDKINDPVCKYLDVVFEKIKYKKHYFGHFHDNWTSSDNKHRMIYREVIELD